MTPGLGQPNINNPKRNTLQQQTVNLQNSPLHVPNHYPSHNKGPFFLGNNFQAIETTHYLVPKLQPETYVRQLYPYYGPPQYSTNFLTSHPDTKTFPYSYVFPGQKPIRFPPTVAPQLPRRPKVAGLSKEEFAKTPSQKKINETKSQPKQSFTVPAVPKKPKLVKKRKPKLAKLSKGEPSATTSFEIISESNPGALTPVVTTLPPLLPAFHPDYRQG